MSRVVDMLPTHPRGTAANLTGMRTCIDACYDCAQACNACADACLGEEMVAELVRCIRLNLDCAQVCEVTGNVLSRMTEPETAVILKLVEACAEACRVCAEECERHADMHEHCRICAEACRRCERACREVLEGAVARSR